MSDMKRLGPQDPLSWIRDTREEIPEPHEQRTVSSERKSFRIQSEGDPPVEITVTIKDEQQDRTICVKITEEGKKPTKIEVKSSGRHKDSPHVNIEAS